MRRSQPRFLLTPSHPISPTMCHIVTSERKRAWYDKWSIGVDKIDWASFRPYGSRSSGGSFAIFSTVRCATASAPDQLVAATGIKAKSFSISAIALATSFDADAVTAASADARPSAFASPFSPHPQRSMACAKIQHVARTIFI